MRMVNPVTVRKINNMSDAPKPVLNALMSDINGVTAPTPKPPAQDVNGEASRALEQAISPKVETPAPKPPGADRFAALAKKERAIQKQLAEVKAAQAKIQAYDRDRASAKQNPIKALEAMGLSYEEITNFILNGQKPTPELELKAVRDEVEALKKQDLDRQARAKQLAKERAEREYQETLNEFKEEVGSFLDENKDSYELTTMYNGNEIIEATIEQHFKSTGKLMSIKEAAELVEAYFEEQVKAATKTKKFQKTDQSSEKVKDQVKKEMGTKQASPTLSNNITSSAPSLLPAKTEADRLQRAMAALAKG